MLNCVWEDGEDGGEEAVFLLKGGLFWGGGWMFEWNGDVVCRW